MAVGTSSPRNGFNQGIGSCNQRCDNRVSCCRGKSCRNGGPAVGISRNGSCPYLGTFTQADGPVGACNSIRYWVNCNWFGCRRSGLIPITVGIIYSDELRADIESTVNELKTMIHSDTDYIAPADFPRRLDTPLLPSGGLSDNLTMDYLESSLIYEKANLRKESWKLAPSFNIGWFTQSLDNIEPFTGWTYGISLPVWFWVPMGKIKSAKIRRDMASNEIENGIHHLESKWYRYNKELEKAEYTLTYFDEKGLSLSVSMISSAEKSYHAGEINLFQYIFTLNEAFSLQLEYLDALNSYNQTVIRINRLLGKI